MANVWIPNKGFHNYDDAQRFGRLIYLTHGSVNRFNTGGMLRQFVEKMSNSTKEDWILMGGLQQLCVLATAIQTMKFGQAKILLYDAKKGKYLPRELDLTSLREE
jgi:hypothetical protein